ncbi:hypothetical protein RHMOL_Rhmol01G0161200 [Rhododendron molle]|uniref:Uncharacterized protein n=1 Tax=Rhododendron molle TaxID=49168 RepID=A0ACC0Q1W6_RHOML|nr:hypothetical protein RHMOL_Rhmol01G0161200 [Rhododendron molle]
MPVVEGSSGGISGSGAGEDDTGPSETPPRDSAKGKGVAIEEEHVEEVQIEEVQTTEVNPVEIREQNIAFRPPAGAATSSRHVPVTYDDIAEHTPDEILARVLEQHPEIGEYILKAKEDRAKTVEAAEAAARAEREAEGERAGSEGLAADVEAEEAEAEEALGPRVSAVAEAGALERPEFSEETYTPPRSHLFVPLGFAGYRPPQQTDYDPELVLRDPGVHIANTWAELWAYEVLKKHPDLSTLPHTRIWSKENMGTKGGRGSLNAYMLYLDELRASQRDRLARPFGIRARREIQEQAREAGAERRAAAEAPRGGERRVRRRESRPVVGGPPELVWKVPAEWVNEALRRMLALENLVRRAAQGMPLQLRYPAPAAQPAQAAASRRTQEESAVAFAATGTTTRPVVTRRQTRSSQPTAASKEAAKKAVARAEERYRIEMREVQGREEPVRKRLVVPDPVEDEEEGDEESKSDSDDTVDDPRYLQNPHELAAADEDDSDDDNGGDDVEEDLRDTDWLGRDEDD